METKTIKYQNKDYKVRAIVDVNSLKTYLVAEESLADAIFHEEGLPLSDDALYIDDSIFYYCNSEEMELSDEEIFNLTI